MAITYETQRVHFEKIAKLYREYLVLYKFFNHGSPKGCTGFDEFYWAHHYYYRHKSSFSLSTRSALA